MLNTVSFQSETLKEQVLLCLSVIDIPQRPLLVRQVLLLSTFEMQLNCYVIFATVCCVVTIRVERGSVIIYFIFASYDL